MQQKNYPTRTFKFIKRTSVLSTNRISPKHKTYCVRRGQFTFLQHNSAQNLRNSHLGTPLHNAGFKIGLLSTAE
jgi:hypothetical protein